MVCDMVVHFSILPTIFLGPSTYSLTRLNFGLFRLENLSKYGSFLVQNVFGRFLKWTAAEFLIRATAFFLVVEEILNFILLLLRMDV